jgi:hypothetical protein
MGADYVDKSGYLLWLERTRGMEDIIPREGNIVMEREMTEREARDYHFMRGN